MDVDQPVQIPPPKCLFNVVLCDPVLYDDVFFYCTPGSIFRVGRTCRNGRYASQEYARRKFNINKHLLRFFPDPLAFRSIQASTKTVISGSTALQFLNRTIYPNSDLDLYVSAEESFALCTFIMSKEGGSYVYKRYSHQSPNFMAAWKRVRSWKPAEGIEEDPFDQAWTGYGSNWIRTVFNFFAKTETGRRNVQVIVTTFDPLSSILGFHSSVVMNAITVDMAISLFPEATFEENLNLFLGRARSENCQAALDKYKERGWELVDELTDEQIKGDKRMFRHGKRWIQDSHTWRLPLSTEGVNLNADADPEAMDLDNPPPTIDSMLEGGFNVTHFEEDKLSMVIFGLVNTKIFTSRFIANRETVEKIEVFETAVKKMAERTLGKLALSPKQCEEMFVNWNKICMNFCNCSICDHVIEEVVPQLDKCEAFKIMLSDFPEMKEIFEEGKKMLEEEEEPVLV
ncbi:hypothetical protein SCHPADRAFT_855455 [Schizopora paradoxa]|uniref:Uncharacterized protein n=1 Tax=Schizopora paradoxa TaxID=27342 RepID=A0A0H2RHP5_9AGAM|nr:hypothetical protein SCHPADRAFT_855455 [Schizopora paradoxa]